jgi:hypothetical protein
MAETAHQPGGGVPKLLPRKLALPGPRSRSRSVGSSGMRGRGAPGQPGLQVVTDRSRPVSTRDPQGNDQFRRFFSALADENLAALLAPIWIV